MTDRSPTRRRVLRAVGAGAGAVALGGCLAAGGPDYERRAVEPRDADPRTTEEMAVAEALAQQDAAEGATSLDSLRLRSHEYVVADGYTGPAVRGTVANERDETVSVVELRVRVYDDAGAQIGRFLASTGDLAPGGTWRFEAILLASPADVAAYAAAVLGVP